MVNDGGRLPLRIILEQPSGVEARFVIPEEFALPTKQGFLLDDFVKGREGIVPVVQFFETNALLKKRLIAPMGRSVLLRRELIVNFDGALVVFTFRRSQLV